MDKGTQKLYKDFYNKMVLLIDQIFLISGLPTGENGDVIL